MMRAVLALMVITWSAAVFAQAGAGDPPTPGQVAQARTVRGPVTAVVRVEPASVRFGDSLALELEVTAGSGVELLMPVFGASLERFRIVEFVPRTRVDDTGRTVNTQTYRLLVLASGEHSIPPIMVEFIDHRPGQRPAPQDEDAYELLTERLAFRVESVVPDDAGGALAPPLGTLALSHPERERAWRWSLLAAALVVAVVTPFAWRALSVWRGQGRRRSAYEVARTRLDALRARPLPDSEAMDSFFVELTDLLRRFLEDRFGLHAPELTTDEFLDVAAGSPDLTAADRRFLRELLTNADRVKFARHVPDTHYVEGALDAVGAFLDQSRELAGERLARAEGMARA